MKKDNSLPRVMVVEDNPTLCSFWRRLFKELEIDNFVIFSDPLKAKKHLNKSIGLLISDVIMPHINGYELAKLACKVAPNMPIILTTAYSTDLSRFDLTGCRFHLLHKPYSNIGDIKKMILHLLKGEDVFEDASTDSFSDNVDYPQVTEWKL